MSLVSLFLFLAYLVWSTWIGIQICAYLRIRMGNCLGDWALGFLFSELFSLLSFWVASKFLGRGIGFALYSQAGLTIALLLTKKFLPREQNCPRLTATPGVIFVASGLVLMAIYFSLFGDMVGASLNNEGVIYQDVIYHVGITQALIEFGFPIPDLQCVGHEIRYHIFTHFFVAKVALLTAWPIYKIFMVLMPIMFSALYSAATVSFFGKILPKSSLRKRMVYVSVILSPMMIGIVGGGYANIGYWLGPAFSYSYGWQIIILTLLFDYLRSINVSDQNPFKSSHLIPLALFLVLATLIKGSSLPLILGGFGFWYFARLVQQRQFERQLFVGIIALTGVGLFTYLTFFSGGVTSGLDSYKLNMRGYDSSLWKVVLNKVGLRIPVLLIIAVWIAAITSFRMILLRDWRSAVTQVFAGMFAVSLLFYFFFPHDPGYFLLPAVFVGNLLAISHLEKHWSSFGRIVRVGCIGLIAFSSYPLSLGQLNAVKIYEQKNRDYLPLTQKRHELFQQLRSHTVSSDIVFTTSCYGQKENAEVILADNFYPAALSGRQFWLGGYRFLPGMKTHPDFAGRIELVNHFSLSDHEHAARLKKAGVKYLLIESKGNHPQAAMWNPESEFNSPHYNLQFSNEAGAILSMVGTN